MENNLRLKIARIFEIVVENSNDIVICISKLFSVTYVNKAAVDFFGMDGQIKNKYGEIIGIVGNSIDIAEVKKQCMFLEQKKTGY